MNKFIEFMFRLNVVGFCAMGIVIALKKFEFFKTAFCISGLISAIFICAILISTSRKK